MRPVLSQLTSAFCSLEASAIQVEAPSGHPFTPSVGTAHFVFRIPLPNRSLDPTPIYIWLKLLDILRRVLDRRVIFGR